MKTTKRFLVSFLIVILGIIIMSFTVSAETEGHYTYTVENGEVTITDVDETISGSVIVPDTLGGYPVKSIGAGAFAYLKNLEGVTIGNSVTSIGQSAFSVCKKLNSIELPNSVITLGDGAFQYCSSLQEVVLSSKLDFIERNLFYGCDNLTSVTFSEDNENFSSDGISIYNKDESELILFAAIGVSNYNIPATVTKILDTYFSDNLEIITVDEDNLLYSSDEYGVLFNKDKTVLIRCPESNKNSEYSVPDSVEKIDVGAFASCENLQTVIIPDSVKFIESTAFGACRNLNNITIGNGIEKIGSLAFSNTGFYNDANNWSDGVLYNGKYLLAYDYELCNKNYTVKDGTRLIADYAFSENIIIGDSEVGNIESVTIPNTVLYIGENAFISCINLKNITIPQSVISIGEDAFSGCTNIERIVVDEDNEYYLSDDGILFNKDKTIIIKYPAARDVDNYEIPNSVDTIEVGAFEFAKFTEISIPDSVKIIEKDAFFSCANLMNIMLPENVVSIGDSAFMYCKNIYNIMIPESVIDIGDWAFYGCRDLESITILNENINICSSMETISPTATIYGYSNSTAQAYAEEFNRTFISLDSCKHQECEWIICIEETCTTIGKKCEYCIVCGELLKEEILPAIGHIETVDEAVEATCTIAGLTEGKHCSVCDEILVEQQETPALGHSDENQDGICDVCGFDNTVGCECRCHRTGIAKFFWAIGNFFRKLFGNRAPCACGVAH